MNRVHSSKSRNAVVSATAAAPIIEIDRLRKAFNPGGHNETVALDDVRFAVSREQFVCLVGPSGCGKSTILNIISGLDAAFEGDVRIEGQRTRSGPLVSYVFQEPRLLPWLTVEKNLHFAFQAEGIPRSEWLERSQHYLGLVGLHDFRHSYPHQLSGGMQHRASIARAFAVQPDILLMDEPFSSLDEFTARALRKELLRIWNQARTTVLFVTHNCFEACFLADCILLMSPRPGRVYETINVDLPRPREYDDPRVFELSASIVQRLLRTMGAD